MNAAVAIRAMRDTRWLLAALMGALLVFELLIMLVFSRLSGSLIEFWRKLPLVAQMLRALVGIDPGRDVTFASFVAMSLVHPFLLVVLWTFLVITCSRDTVGAMDRGTADLRLALPVTRFSIYTSVSAVWMGSIALLALTVWFGIGLAARMIPTPEPVIWSSYWRPVTALLCFSLAIGCGTMCVSSFASRRAHAIGVVVSALLFSFLLNFVAAFLPALEPLSILGILHYYRPVDIVREAELPMRDLTVLLIGAAVAWLLGLWRYCTRDIPAA